MKIDEGVNQFYVSLGKRIVIVSSPEDNFQIHGEGEDLAQ